MSAERFFESFETFKDTDSRIKVLIAADREKDLVFQRLTLDQDVSKEFKEDAFNAFTDGENFRFAKYEPGYKPEDDEICYLPLNESEDVKKVVEGVFDAAKNFNSIELFKGDDEIIDNLRFYVVIVDGAPPAKGPIPVQYSSERLLQRTSWPKVDGRLSCKGRTTSTV